MKMIWFIFNKCSKKIILTKSNVFMLMFTSEMAPFWFRYFCSRSLLAYSVQFLVNQNQLYSALPKFVCSGAKEPERRRKLFGLQRNEHLKIIIKRWWVGGEGRRERERERWEREVRMGDNWSLNKNNSRLHCNMNNGVNGTLPESPIPAYSPL